MRIVITGGGTGGHVFPALEVARLARDRGHEILYLGSVRGQEAAVCQREGILFHGFPSQPLYSLKSPSGWKAAAAILRARMMAQGALKAAKPSVVFSTGGYSAGPIVSAARKLHIPYMLHEQNSAPGRSNLLFAKEAFVVGTVFRSAANNFPGAKVIRTGMPIRRELRAASEVPREPGPPTILVTGGSQGSAFLNEAIPPVAKLLDRSDVHWLHLTGKGGYESVKNAVGNQPNYRVEPFLESGAMAAALRSASVVVSRAGGSLAEAALFGVPTVLVPLPTAAADHQTANAMEFVEMGAAILHRQRSFDAGQMAKDVAHWLDDQEAVGKAKIALKSFDVPDATMQILKLLEEESR